MENIRELVFVSLEKWDEIWRRNQFLCDGLLNRHPDLRILFVEPSKDVSNAVRTGRWSQLFQPRTRRIDASGRLLTTASLKLFPDSIGWCRRMNESMARRHIRSTSKRLGFQKPLLWINAHSMEHLVGTLNESAMIYDVTDDWTSIGQAPVALANTVAQDRALCRQAGAVIVCSEKLARMKESLATSVHLIPNGVDAVHYGSVRDSSLPLPPDARWKGPVLGYTGSIHAERVDLALVEAMAKKLPHATILLVGPIMLSTQARQRLESIGNIVLTGPRPYSVLPSYMRAFDVCITPHLVTPFTESLNPIKLWEYLAAGKPIISTRVAGFRDFPELVYLADTADDFAQGLSTALAEPASQPLARLREAKMHGWDRRIADVEKIIGDLLNPGAVGVSSTVGVPKTSVAASAGSQHLLFD